MIFLCVYSYGKSGREIIVENGFKPYVQPLLSTKWAQYGGGENALLPIVDDRLELVAKTGCGATALAQIMKYWDYPKYGIGSNFYTWQYPDESVYFSRFADFSESEYDWQNMINVYFNNNDRTQVQVDAVSKLMYDIGIALEMKYKNWNTATQIEYISTVLKKYFGYNQNLRLVIYGHHGYTMDEWRAIIYRELSEGRPILMGANNKDGVRHIFVADGYNEDGLVHFNLGHAKDSENKYYDVTQDKGYTISMRMLIGISPQELSTDIVNVHVATPGSLLESMGGDTASKKICRLKVTGFLNDMDFSTLRKLCTADVGQSILSNIGQLSYIDLSDAEIYNNAIPDNAFYEKNYPCLTLQSIKLPKTLKKIGNNAFRGCVGLLEVQLPSELEEIGSMAFFNCRYLDNILIPSSVRFIGKYAFAYTKMSSFEIDKDNSAYCVRNDAIFTIDGRRILAYVGKGSGKFVIPQGVEEIDAYAFGGKAILSGLEILASLQKIGSDAFEKCTGLKDIYIYSLAEPNYCDAFFPEYLTCTLHVPYGLKSAYTEKWPEFRNIIEDIDPGLAGIETITTDKKKTKLYDIGGKVVHQAHGVIISNGMKYIKK